MSGNIRRNHRILHVMPFTGMGGGAPRAALTLVEELARRGPAWVFSLTDDAFAKEARMAGARVICAFPSGWPTSRVKRWTGTIRAIYQAIREHRIDLIHCHSTPGNRYCFPASRLARVPLVTHQRDTYKPDHFHAWVHRTDRIIATSAWVKSNLPARLHDKVTIVHDAVKIPEDNQIIWPQRGGHEAAERLRVGMAGRCVPEKGHDLLVDAAIGAMQDLTFDVEIWGVNEEDRRGEFVQGLFKKIRDAGLEDRFSWEGYRLDMDVFYRRMDVVVTPSRVAEGFGLTAAEGQAWGKAVIVAGHAGLAEIVRDDVDGLVFTPHDSASLRQQLRRILTDAALRQRLSRAARAEAMERFAPAVHADRIENVYEGLLTGR